LANLVPGWYYGRATPRSGEVQPDIRKLLLKFQHPHSAWIILACSIIVTLVGWQASVYVVDQKAKEIFRLRVREATQAITGRLKDCEFVLQSTIPAANGSESREEWNNYTRGLQIEELFPGIIALGYVSHVPAKQLPAYLAAHGNKNNHLYAKNARAYAPITYVGPATVSHEGVMGFDMYSEPVRREALDRSRLTGKLSLSSPAQLLTESEMPGSRAGLLMYLPVFKHGKVPATREGREKDIQGYVYGVFRMQELIAGLLGSSSFGLNVEIAELGQGGSGDESILFTSAAESPPKKEAVYSSANEVEIGGRRWVFRFSASEEALEGGRVWQSTLVAAGGLLVNFLMFFVVAAITSRSVNADQKAASALREVRRARETFELAVQGSSDGIWDWNMSTNEVYYSPRLKSMLGYEPDEVPNTVLVWERFIHPEDRNRAVSIVQKHLAEKSAKFELSLRLRTKNDDYKWILIRGAVLRDSDGRPYRMAGSNTDITERILFERELIRARDGAEQAARAKAEFLATMSHEIRTPLNGVIGMASLLAETQISEEQSVYVRGIETSASALLLTINDILDFSKLEAGKGELAVKEFELGKLLSNVRDMFQVPAAMKKLRFEVTGPELPFALKGDGSRLQQVLANLVGNAIKFTDEGFVSVNATAEESAGRMRMTFTVTDSGLGISEDTRKMLFRPFTRGRTSRNFAGTGLGLSISRRIITMMGGEIDVVSREGIGSTFWFKCDLEKGGNVSAPEPGREVRSLLGARILLAEDNEVNQLVISRMLEKEGYQVKAVVNGLQALLAARNENFDLILLDCRMPEMDGYEAAARIRELKGYDVVPILAITANVSEADQRRCLEAGMDGMLVKPMGADTLRAKVASWIHASRETPYPASRPPLSETKTKNDIHLV
jgi:PAS domain S-box-containing protein